jgi:hypothetical protein
MVYYTQIQEKERDIGPLKELARDASRKFTNALIQPAISTTHHFESKGRMPTQVEVYNRLTGLHAERAALCFDEAQNAIEIAKKVLDYVRFSIFYHGDLFQDDETAQVGSMIHSSCNMADYFLAHAGGVITAARSHAVEGQNFDFEQAEINQSWGQRDARLVRKDIDYCTRTKAFLSDSDERYYREFWSPSAKPAEDFGTLCYRLGECFADAAMYQAAKIDNICGFADVINTGIIPNAMGNTGTWVAKKQALLGEARHTCNSLANLIGLPEGYYARALKYCAD